MWTVVYMAQSGDIAEKIQKKLLNQGIMAKMDPINKENESEDGCFEILVPEEQVDQAHGIIIQLEI